MEQRSKAAAIELTAEELARIEQVSPKDGVHGTRYMKELMSQLNG